jgi:ABC-type antimicrobial peptide transport system permease subunit
VRELDPNQPIRDLQPLERALSDSIARDGFFTLLYGVFGGLALILAGVGVYGVLAYAVGQRTREIGVRVALGARAADVLRLVMGSGMRLVLVGLSLGTVAALLVTQVLRGQLHEISALDPWAFAAALAMLLAVALLACYVPARRAMRVDPITAFRAD